MFRRDVVYVFGGVLPLALSALIMPALTRILGQRQFGIASFAVALSSVLVLVLTLGLQTGVQREYPTSGGVQRSRRLTGMSIVLIVVLAAVLVVSAPGWAALIGAGRFPWAMELVAYWSGGAAIALVCLGYLRSADRLRAYLVVVLLQSVGAQAIGVAMVLTTHRTAKAYLFGLLIGQAAATGVALLLVRPLIGGPAPFRTLTRALGFSAPLVPQQLAAFILWSGDRIIVQRDLGSTAQARYTVAYAVGAITINLVSQLNQAWMPRVFAIGDVDERRAVLAQVQWRLSGLLRPAVVGLSMVTPFVLMAASPASYHPRALVLVTLLVIPTALPYSVALANTRTLLAHGRSTSLAIVTVVAAVANMILNVILVPRFGIAGSAAATLFCYALLAWLSTAIVRQEVDRLPGLLRAEAVHWALAGTCLATALLPTSLGTGLAGRGVGVAMVLTVAVVATRHRSGPASGSAHAWFRRIQRSAAGRQVETAPMAAVAADADSAGADQ